MSVRRQLERPIALIEDGGLIGSISLKEIGDRWIERNKDDSERADLNERRKHGRCRGSLNDLGC
jgi:hypothetical protein